MRQWVDAYLRDQHSAWAPSTLQSETSRLRSIAPHLSKAPVDVHRWLTANNQKPYTIKTTFIRLCSFESWLIRQGHLKEAKFAAYMEKHRNRFKHAYVKEDVNVSYEEARERIEKLPEPARKMAIGLLQNGLRLSEAYNVKDGKVVGKGGKPRNVYGTIEETVPRSTLWKKLKSVGLKPHMLRKLLATRLSDNGATPADLCQIFGWSSFATAYQYAQAKNNERLKTLVETSAKGSADPAVPVWPMQQAL